MIYVFIKNNSDFCILKIKEDKDVSVEQEKCSKSDSKKALCHPQQVQLIVVTKLQNAKYSTSCIADYFPVLPDLSHDDEQIVATLTH